jgi:hypothetical protein
LRAQCFWISSSPASSPGPSSSAVSPPVRTITEANLIAAGDLPPPMGGGKTIEYRRDARSLDQLSICQGFGWSPVVADPAQAEVSEVVYQPEGSQGPSAFHESVGLTILEERMMITVHLFYTDESPYSLNIDEDEAGFAHPQLGLVAAAAKRLSEWRNSVVAEVQDCPGRYLW